MRYFMGLVLALALGVMGCSETSGAGGSGGDGGIGGDGGQGGVGGSPVACVDFVCPCTEEGIRAAIAEGGGPFTFDCDGATTVPITDNLTAGTDLILDGEGNLTIEGGGLMTGGSGVSLELRGITFSNLESPIFVSLGSLIIVDSRITDSENGAIAGLFCGDPSCAAPELPGLTIRNTNISGGIDYLGEGPGIIEYSTIEGGYIRNQDRVGCGPLTIRNTTVSGSLLDLCGEVTISNSTVSRNSLEAIRFRGGLLKIANSTVSGDVHYWNAQIIEFRGLLLQGTCIEEAPEGAEPTSLGYNIESPGDTCGFDQPTDQVNVSEDDLKLGPLQDNGGPTETHALGEGSVAIDQIPAEDCVDADGAPLTTDQRGEPRPVGPDPKRCDVGAFEVQP